MRGTQSTPPEDRLLTASFTDEMARAYDYTPDNFRELIEEKALELERSINGVVWVYDDGMAVNVRCIMAEDADEHHIRRLMEDLSGSLYRVMDREGQ